MGYSKKQLIDAQNAASPESCSECKWEYSGDFRILCIKHQREFDAQRGEAEYWESVNEGIER